MRLKIVVDEVSGNDVDRWYYSKQFPDLLLPGNGRTVELNPPLEITVPRKTHTYGLHARMQSENGTFPKGGRQRIQFKVWYRPRKKKGESPNS